MSPSSPAVKTWISAPMALIEKHYIISTYCINTNSTMLALLDSNGDIVLDSDGDWLDSDGDWVAINPPSPQRKASAVEVPRTHLEPSP